ncbi:MerR family DNA-binding transcriptional regulator [Amycolatopsis sp. H20-H5]|uniref:MerR family DNA-binding transcriptional regulator n=1 Tax=Amycolatopsis sp. H20-H5 TaxID=3046309 RepID=UPI002DBFB50C|nr:MerR family DNA-binding transcriptional regulator [Amycolatopsis sp. H20-H5]MEC3975561.1 MerR family DNA-binding transcriptional regulator [Amycolatopsis sp. H20-H5]
MTASTTQVTQVTPSQAKGKESLTVSDLARASGVAASAVRFYEKHGLITGWRTSGNQRRFRPVDACLIKIVRVAQRIGLSVTDIRKHLAALPDDHQDLTAEDFKRLRHRLEIEAHERIQALVDVLEDLDTSQNLCKVQPRSRTIPD